MENYDFSKVEPQVLKFWETNDTWQKINRKNAGKKKFYFLDGPPYTSGRVHIGTAWNKSMKDLVLRYRRMRGHDVWDRAGYDMHGMPTEQATMKELGIERKDEIEKMGIEKFVTACRTLAIRNMLQMNKDFTRLGVWMDFEDAYMPIKPEYIEGEWWLIKKAYENGRLYLGEKTMTWCPKCATSLAKHELEYAKLNDNSIFLKFRLLGAENEYLIIWTTTPWTIPFNLGVMANPKVTYVKAKVGRETWILAKDLADSVIKDSIGKDHEILEEIKGEGLKGLKYIHPLHDELKEHYEAIRSDKVHTVVMSEEYVTVDAGSGLVHMAPGCGPEDYEVGYREGIPPFNTVDDNGVFAGSMGPFAGWAAKKDDHKFIDFFEDKGDMLIHKAKLSHDYAHCWRCKSAIIYRTTKQWFFKIEDLKENMRELNKSIKWIPDYAGSRNFDSWLENLRDNGITRQRYWGTPLPVWKCDKCNEIIVIGSLDELKKHVKALPDDLHKPWIDDARWKCKCKGTMTREPDVLDVWIDAGTASWNCIHYPQNKELFEKLFPADFILEGIDQVRGWFNLLFVASMVSMQKPSFKAVYMHGFVQDSLGRKMSKSLGNYILPGEVIDKYGADTLRYYMIGAANPGLDLNYNFEDMKIKNKNLAILWNLMNLVLDMADTNHLKPGKPDAASFTLAERYIYSKMHSAIETQTEKMDNYILNETPWVAEELYLELSRTYIQLARDRISAGDIEEKQMIFDVVFEVLMNTIKLFAPVCPLITEGIYQNLRQRFSLKEESIHGCTWPEHDKKMIDFELESDVSQVKAVVQAILSGREKAQLGQRWPLKSVAIVTLDSDTRASIDRQKELVLAQTNIKELHIKDIADMVRSSIKPNLGPIGKDFGALRDKIVARLMQTNYDALQKELKSGGHKIAIDGKEILIEEKHVVVERIIPEGFIEVEFKAGHAYLDVTRTPELEQEGFAREVMRRVQALRKDMDLKKNNRIELAIETSEPGLLKPWEDEIKQKVGADTILVTTKAPAKGTAKEEKIKGKTFVLHVTKVAD